MKRWWIRYRTTPVIAGDLFEFARDCPRVGPLRRDEDGKRKQLGRFLKNSATASSAPTGCGWQSTMPATQAQTTPAGRATRLNTSVERPMPERTHHRRGVEDASGEVTNGTYFSLMPLAIWRFNSARGLVNQPQ